MGTRKEKQDAKAREISRLENAVIGYTEDLLCDLEVGVVNYL